MQSIFEAQQIIISEFEQQNFQHRLIFDEINLDNKLTGVVGACGVGKTTLLLQQAINAGAKQGRALYVLADNVFFLEHRLIDLVDYLYKETDVELLCVDEIHKYPNWQQELKNIADIYQSFRVLFSGSSMIDIIRGKYDLSRRVTLYSLYGFSFREYLQIVKGIDVPKLTLEQLLDSHQNVARDLNLPKVLKYFDDYLHIGYYPYFLELSQDKDKLQAINHAYKKTIYEDVASMHALKTSTLQIMDNLFRYSLITPAGELSVNKLASYLGRSFDSVSDYLAILQEAGLLRAIYKKGHSKQHLRNPTKVYPDNPNLIDCIALTGTTDQLIGKKRETFMVSHCQNAGYEVVYSAQGDCQIQDHTFEVGGKRKTAQQIKQLEKAYVVKDGIVVGDSRTIPLYLWGLLY